MLLVLNMSGFWIYLFQNIRKFRLLKYKKRSVSWNIRIFFLRFPFPKNWALSWENIRHFFRAGFWEPRPESARAFLRKYKKSFLFRKYKNFLNLRVRMFHFLKYKKFFWGRFFYFLRLGPKVSISRGTRRCF